MIAKSASQHRIEMRRIRSRVKEREHERRQRTRERGITGIPLFSLAIINGGYQYSTFKFQHHANCTVVIRGHWATLREGGGLRGDGKREGESERGVLRRGYSEAICFILIQVNREHIGAKIKSCLINHQRSRQSQPRSAVNIAYSQICLCCIWNSCGYWHDNDYIRVGESTTRSGTWLLCITFPKSSPTCLCLQVAFHTDQSECLW